MDATRTDRAGVLGAGSWGTALAVHLSGSGREVALWARDEALVAEMTAARTNRRYLPGVDLPSSITVSASLAEALAGTALVLLAVPSHGLRAVVRRARLVLPSGAILVSATKGLESDTLQRMSEVLAEETGGRHPVVVLSGPSFASEVVRRLPTALVVASSDEPAMRRVQHELRSASLRLYGSDDVAGVEIGASLKNVIAIAAGVVEALELGHNALAALITRGLAEMSRLSSAMGGRRDTLAGLSGLGDLVLTCTGAQMAEVLAGRKTPLEAVGCLMLRPQRGESDGGS
jgi:glycerol-3-phosphate dehydrogenase (NAD(P)+)